MCFYVTVLCCAVLSSPSPPPEQKRVLEQKQNLFVEAELQRYSNQIQVVVVMVIYRWLYIGDDIKVIGDR